MESGPKSPLIFGVALANAMPALATLKIWIDLAAQLVELAVKEATPEIVSRVPKGLRVMVKVEPALAVGPVLATVAADCRMLRLPHLSKASNQSCG